MKQLFLFLLLAVFAWGGTKVYTLAFPKERQRYLCHLIEKELEALGYVKGENLRFLEIDLSKAASEHEMLKKRIESEADLFCCTGNRLNVLLQTVKPKVPVLFMGVKGAHPIPEDMKPYATGIYRSLSIEKIFERMGQILPRSDRLAFLFKRGSGLHNLAPKFTKMCKKIGIDLIEAPYDTPEDFDPLFGRLKNRVDGVILFPPSVSKSALPKLIDAQFKHNLPVLAQVEEDIEAGALGGPAINYTYTTKKMASYADRIFRGHSPGELPIYFDRTQFMINLTTASKLNITIPETIASQAKILGITHPPQASEKKQAPLKTGSYTIAVPQEANKRSIKRTFEKLEERGYTPGKNLTILRFPAAEAAPKADMILTTGNIVTQVLKNNPGRKIVATSIFQRNLKQQTKDTDVHMIYRSSMAKLEEMVTTLFPESRLGVLYHSDSKLNESGNFRKIIDNLQTLGMRIDEQIYHEESQLKTIMQAWKEKKTAAVLLFPPSLKEDADIKTMVTLQRELKLPVISQSEWEIRAGMALGVRVTGEEVHKQIALTCDHVLQNEEKKLPKTTYIKSGFMINLPAVQQLGLNIPSSVITNAKIVYE